MENPASRHVKPVKQAEPSYMSLPTSRLAIGETCCHCTVKNGLHQRFGCEPKEEEKNGTRRKFNSIYDKFKNSEKTDGL